MEADKVVFMGYSLPQADFELRQLLSRSIRKDAKIEVILSSAGNPDNYKDVKQKQATSGFRYTSFFSGRKVTISYDGVQEYIFNRLVN